MNSTKAETLDFLSAKLSHSRIESMLFFSVKEWESRKPELLREIENKFERATIIIRSSGKSEDSETESLAGYFESVLDVSSTDQNQISDAVDLVLKSFRKAGKIDSLDQVLIQKQLLNVSCSGVILTRTLISDLPYYVINYTNSNDTTAVTAGKSSKTVTILKSYNGGSVHSWERLINAVKEIEEFYDNKTLDIEFGILQEGQVSIFQVRPLAANYSRKSRLRVEFIRDLVTGCSEKFTTFSEPVPHLGGKRTIFSDMADWNPAEIIGDRPKTLDYSLYRFLITDNEWHVGRTSLGYFDVSPAELMTSFGRKPYIDVRLSFNSLTPKSLNRKLRSKLVDYYIDKLAANPHLHDKVEFEILHTCLDPSTPDSLNRLRGSGFSCSEVEELKASLKKLTKDMFHNGPEIFKRDETLLAELEFRRRESISRITRDSDPWELLDAAYYILHNCRRLGTAPFARMARLAFVAKSQLVGLKKMGVISEEQLSLFFENISTVASDLIVDLGSLQRGSLSSDMFFEKFGHLRAGTYDITSPRYDASKEAFLVQTPQSAQVVKKCCTGTFESIFSEQTQKMEDYLDWLGGPDEFFSFIKRAIELREKLKFDFSRCLSDALELIAEAGDMLGFTREEMANVSITDVFRARNPETKSIERLKEHLSRSISHYKNLGHSSRSLVLPSVITDEADFYVIKQLNSEPNYITNGMTEGNVQIISPQVKPTRQLVEDKIVFIESADPGYDWIFTFNPKGLVTKFGGVASHMAIRCAEFNLPACIGLGEKYNRMAKTSNLVLDAKNKKIYCL